MTKKLHEKYPSKTRLKGHVRNEQPPIKCSIINLTNKPTVDDRPIPGTTAQISLQCFLDFVHIRCGFVAKQRVHGHDHARGAESTLGPV